MTKNKKILNNLVIYTLLVLVTAFIYLFIKNNNNLQFNIFFDSTSNSFADFYNPLQYSYTKNPYEFSLNLNSNPERAYPPFAYLIFYLFTRFSDFQSLSPLDAWHSNLLLTISIVFFAIIIFLLFLLLYENLKINKGKRLILIFILFFSSIFLFSIERGNIIILSALFVTFFIFNYSNENRIIRELSFISLALAAGLKIFPALYGILLITEKRYLEALRLIIYGILIFILPFLFFEGGLNNVPLLINNTIESTIKYSEASFPRYSFRLWLPMITNLEIKNLLLFILPHFQLISFMVSMVLLFLNKQKFNSILIITLVILIFPVNSAIYNGLYIFAVIVLFINKTDFNKIYLIYSICFILIINPLQLFFRNINLTLVLHNLSISILFIIVLIDTFQILIRDFKTKKLL